VAESIKERILRAAQTDPFLSVEAIARQAGTTQQYVRTILSESGLSLTRLRREYVQNMEQRVGRVRGDGEELNLPEEGGLEIRQISAPQLARLLQVREDVPLSQASRFAAKAGAQGFAQLITALPLTLKGDITDLRELLPTSTGELSIGRQWAVVVPAPAALQSVWGVGSGEPLFRLGTLWVAHHGPMAVEFFWVPARGHAITWSGQGGELCLEMYKETAYG
jgi:hypothetical protein